MKTTVKRISCVLLIAFLMLLLLSFVMMVIPRDAAYAAEETSASSLEIEQEKTKQIKAWTAAIVLASVATAGAIAMGLAIIKAIDAITRQPEADGKIRTTMMLGLVFVETAIIYSLIVAILLIFVL